MIKAIIVDDEAPARRELARLLAEHSAVQIVGEASSLDVARGLLLRTRPDVIFLDIRLGKQSGFDLLPDVDPQTTVIFVTAYDSYAIKAFEAHAFDYLMKPVEPARLQTSIRHLDHAMQQRGGSVDASNLRTGFQPTRWIFIDHDNRPAFVEIASVTHLVAESGSTTLHTKDGVGRTISGSLMEWERKLPMDDFKRVHRNAIVNLRHVQRVEPWSNYSYRIHLAGSTTPIAMSRRYSVLLRHEMP